MTRKTLTGLAISLLLVASGAQAALQTSGASFVAYNAGEANNVDNVVAGARTSSSAGQTLVSSVTRNTIGGGLQSFTITGYHVGTLSTQCSIYATRPDGIGAASRTLVVTNVSGAWSRTASMAAAELPSDARVVAICTIPGPYSASLAGISTTP
jgi:hypothetical protein